MLGQYPVPCRLFVRAVTGARVIGKNGESIKAIRYESHANVRVLLDELPEVLKQQEGAIIDIHGPENSIRQALHGVLERCFDRSGLPPGAMPDKDKPCIIDVLCPERSAGLLIGPGGDRVRALMEETNCGLDVEKSTVVAGLYAQKRVRVFGATLEAVYQATWRVIEALAEFLESGALSKDDFQLRETADASTAHAPATTASEPPVQILLAGAEMAWVVGKMGYKIARLRDLAPKVHVDDAPAPLLHSDRILSIPAVPLEDKLEVARQVVADLAARTEGLDCVRVLAPPGFDRGAGSLNLMMQRTGADIRLITPGQTSDGKDLGVLEIRGTEETVVYAVRLVHGASSMHPPERLEPTPLPPLKSRREPAPTGPTVFVAGLNLETTSEGLRELFVQAGEVLMASVFFDRESGKSRGVGKVVFATSESQQYAISHLHQKELDGVQINVREFIEKEGSSSVDRSGSPERGPRAQAETSLSHAHGDAAMSTSSVHPVYKAPEPVFKASEPAYKVSEPAYKAPEPANKTPEPTYKAPEPTMSNQGTMAAASSCAPTMSAHPNDVSSQGPLVSSTSNAETQRADKGSGAGYAPNGATFDSAAPLVVANPLSTPSASEVTSLYVIVPNEKIAASLVSAELNIGRQAGVRLEACPMSLGYAAVMITGSPSANAMACYHIQMEVALMQMACDSFVY